MVTPSRTYRTSSQMRALPSTAPRNHFDAECAEILLTPFNFSLFTLIFSFVYQSVYRKNNVSPFPPMRPAFPTYLPLGGVSTRWPSRHSGSQSALHRDGSRFQRLTGMVRYR